MKTANRLRVSIIGASLFTAGLLSIGPAITAQETVDEVGAWLNDRAMQAAQQTSLSDARIDDAPGTYQVIPLAELDAPEAVKRKLRQQLQRHQGDVVSVSDGSIPSERELMASLPTTLRSTAELRRRLPNPPSTLQSTVLGAAQSIGMEPSGALDGVMSSGLTRFFRIEGVGVVEFNEDNYKVPGTRIEIIAESQNTTVNGASARLEMNTDATGRSRSSLVWAGQEKVYTLTAIGKADARHQSQVLREIAAAIVD